MNFDDLEPHLNADGYRNFNPLNLADRQIDFIEFNQDGNFIVGCSSLTGRYWTGSVFYCNSVEGSPDNAIASVHCESGVTDGKFIGDREVLIAEDSGCIKVVDIQAKRNEFSVNKNHSMSMTCVSASCQHDDTILSLSVFHDKSHAVSCGADKNIKVIDVKTLVAEHTYRPAHRRSVTSVCVQPEDGNVNVFASSSLDGYALLWDTRKATPAVIVLKNTEVELTAVTWHPSKHDVLAVGSAQGDVSLMDVRQMGQISMFRASTRPIYRMQYAQHCSDWLAICSNDTQVKVFDTSANTPKLIYNDDRHTDFVRGLAWHPKSHKLTSGSWDWRVLTHSVVSPSNME